MWGLPGAFVHVGYQLLVSRGFKLASFLPSGFWHEQRNCGLLGGHGGVGEGGQWRGCDVAQDSEGWMQGSETTLGYLEPESVVDTGEQIALPSPSPRGRSVEHRAQESRGGKGGARSPARFSEPLLSLSPQSAGHRGATQETWRLWTPQLGAAPLVSGDPPLLVAGAAPALPQGPVAEPSSPEGLPDVQVGSSP